MGVLLVVIYDILQEFFKSISSQPYPDLNTILLNFGTKLFACAIVLLIGIFWLQKYADKNEVKPNGKKRSCWRSKRFNGIEYQNPES